MDGIKILLDTNIISSLMSSDEGLATKIDSVEMVYISAVSLGELYFGAYNSLKIEHYLRAISSVVVLYSALHIDEQTAQIYGRLKSDLKKKGRPIPENDIWIASISIQHNLVLISRDQHFSEIEYLKWEIW